MLSCAWTPRFVVASIAFVVGGSGAACTPDIDCDALCARTLACEVTFGPSDDPDGARIASGERSDAESCALGCEESPRVTVDNARCIDELTITDDPASCQNGVMECLGLAQEIPAGSEP
jgi:hypothetical protein